uniref:Myocardin related transcription factor Ab n=1 Tax=Tetraodon nigroviridis TaxID=99883 RepID=H3CF37_TETNG
HAALKSPAAFHEQRRSLERARTEDYLKRKIRSRPMRSELVRMHILEETSAEPLQAKQLAAKGRARPGSDDLNDKISHRPGPIELVHKNILSVSCYLKTFLLVTDSPKGAGGESSSLDEDSSDALSPDQPTNHDSPSSAVPQLSPSDMLSQNGDMSPSQVRKQKKPQLLTRTLSLQFITQSPPPPLPPQVNGSESPVFPKVANGLTGTLSVSRSATGQLKQSQAKTSAERPPQRSKKLKDSKPKVKKLKYHQYIPRDQKADKERPRQMDSSYAKLLQQQQLFLQLQILSQQQQHYNYHTILRAPPKSASEPPPTTSSGPSPSRSISTPTTPTPSSQNTAARQSQTAAGGAKPSSLPANLDEFKVAELKQELKLRGLTVSGTKNDLIERLRNYQEQNGSKSCKPQPGQQTLAVSPFTTPPTTVPPSEQQPGEVGFKLALSPLTQMVPGRVMRFGSTSSSPPLSPCPSERSLAGMSPDETSCNGDMFGEMVSSPLTQLTLHPSPQHPPVSTILARPLAAACQASESLPSFSAETIDKDQMLQEKDKQIEELTRMLRQKQRLVETLRSQLEQGKLACGSVLEKEGGEKSRASPDSEQQTLMRASPLQAPNLQNDLAAKVKKEKQTVQQTQMQVQEKAESKPNPQKQQQPKKEAPNLLKANGAPTLVTDSNGNHYLIALTTEGQNGAEGGTSPGHQWGASAQPGSYCPACPSGQKEEVCLPYDWHTLFTPPSPKPKTSPPSQRSKDVVPSQMGKNVENGMNSQQMDDLFDILLKSGEIPGLKSNPDPSLAPVHSDPSSSASPPSPLQLPSPTHKEPLGSPHPPAGAGNIRLEDFLHTTTGPLLGAELDGALTLIDDLHSQMLSTASILDHPPSPMDTSDLGFSTHSAGLDFDHSLDSMDWLDISTGDGGTDLAPLAPHTPPSVFSTDFLDSTDLQLNWEGL